MVLKDKQHTNHGNSFAFIISLMIMSFSNSFAIDTDTGDILQIAVPLVGLGKAVYLKDNEGSKQLFLTVLTTSVTSHLLKAAFKGTDLDKRPNGKSGSFPSAHTSCAFSGAVFLHKRYGLLWGAPAYFASSLVGVSRIDSRNHYFRDVLAGGLIAVTLGYFFVDSYESQWGPELDVANKSIGCSFRYRF